MTSECCHRRAVGLSFGELWPAPQALPCEVYCLCAVFPVPPCCSFRNALSSALSSVARYSVRSRSACSLCRRPEPGSAMPRTHLLPAACANATTASVPRALFQSVAATSIASHAGPGVWKCQMVTVSPGQPTSGSELGRCGWCHSRPAAPACAGPLRGSAFRAALPPQPF